MTSRRSFALRSNFDDVEMSEELAAVRAYYPEARAFIAGVDPAALVDLARPSEPAWPAAPQPA